MIPGLTSEQLPPVVGWIAGYTLSLVIGLVAWVLSDEWMLGVVLFAASGGALGAVIAQHLSARSLIALELQLRHRAHAWVLAALVLFGSRVQFVADAGVPDVLSEAGPDAWLACVRLAGL